MPNYTNTNSFFSNKVVKVNSINTTFSTGEPQDILFRCITIPLKYNPKNPEDVSLVKASFFTNNKTYKPLQGGLISYAIMASASDIDKFINKDNYLYERISSLYNRSVGNTNLIVQVALLDIANLDSNAELTDVDMLNDIYNKNQTSRAYKAFLTAVPDLKSIGFIILDFNNLYTKERLEETAITLESSIYIFGCDLYRNDTLSTDYTGLNLSNVDISFKYINKQNTDEITLKKVSNSIYTKNSLINGLPDSDLKTWITGSANNLFFYLNLEDFNNSSESLEISKIEGTGLTLTNYIGSNIKISVPPTQTEWIALNTILIDTGLANNTFIYTGFSSISLTNNFIKKEFIRSSITKDISSKLEEVLFIIDVRHIYYEENTQVNSLFRRALWSLYSNTTAKLTLGAYKDKANLANLTMFGDDASLVYFLTYGDGETSPLASVSYTQYNSIIPELLVVANNDIREQLGTNFSLEEKNLFINDARGIVGFLEEGMVEGKTIFRLYEDRTCYLTEGTSNTFKNYYIKAYINKIIVTKLNDFISTYGANALRTISRDYIEAINRFLSNDMLETINSKLDMENNTEFNEIVPLESTNPGQYVTTQTVTTALGSQDTRLTFNFSNIYRVKFLAEVDYYNFSYTTSIPA